MTDPVVDPEGNSYEKSAILDWLSRDATSPITRTPLRANQLTPNRVLRDLLDLHHRHHRRDDAGDDADQQQHQQRQNGEPSSAAVLASGGGKIGVTLQASYYYSKSPSNDNKKTFGLVRVSVADDQQAQEEQHRQLHQRHTPSEIVCVIDVSYSMDSAAKMHGDSEGSAGLSLLDIVKHATATVIETLDDADKLAIVAYASSARVVLPFTNMNKAGKTKAKDAVKKLRTCGNTNIWDGLSSAMDLVEKEGDTQNANILLLTDGLPNVHPPRGELPTLVRYLEAHPDLRCRISTFGFGYSLDSQLLNNIAIEGGGHYGFIPDSSFVGTVFINAISNILSTAIPDCELLLENTTPGVTIEKCLSSDVGGTQTSWGMSISLPGGLRYGQTFDVLVELKDERTSRGQDDDNGTSLFISSLSLGRTGGNSNLQETTETTAAVRAGTEHDLAQIESATQRSKVVYLIRRNQEVEYLTQAQASTKALLNEMRSSLAAKRHNANAAALLEDLKGQITEAYSRRDWFAKWGRHYLLSLARAHELQQCSNFKDPGVQVYSTAKFALIRDRAEELFCKLPPPTPSLARDDANAPNGNGKHVRRVRQNMRAYHNAGAPCFAAGEVRMEDGRLVSVTEIVAGDMVATTSSGRPAKVRCVVATACEEGIANLVELEGGVLVTPWHPVRPSGGGSEKWSFPEALAPVASYACDKVYSFVLEEGSTGAMQIGPYEAVTLGHGFDDGDVVKHEFLGTEKVIEDLAKKEGWEVGMVELGPNPAVRDDDTGLIVAFRQASY